MNASGPFGARRSRGSTYNGGSEEDCDCDVGPGVGEGVGLPLGEGLGCGVPVSEEEAVSEAVVVPVSEVDVVVSEVVVVVEVGSGVGLPLDEADPDGVVVEEFVSDGGGGVVVEDALGVSVVLSELVEGGLVVGVGRGCGPEYSGGGSGPRVGEGCPVAEARPSSTTMLSVETDSPPAPLTLNVAT